MTTGIEKSSIEQSHTRSTLPLFLLSLFDLPAVTFLLAMPPQSDIIIDHLQRQIALAKPHPRGIPPVMPVASPADVAAAEEELGFAIPPLLIRIYCEIGNGGCQLGPGLIGLPGGYDNDEGTDVVRTSIEMAEHLPWWDDILVLCDWGCGMMSCVDCSDDGFGVYRWDGNAWDDTTDFEGPSDELWSLECHTFDEWIMTARSHLA